MKKSLLSLFALLPIIAFVFFNSTTHAYAATRLEPTSYEPIPCFTTVNQSCTTLRIYYNQAPPAGQGWGLMNYVSCCGWSGSAGPTNINTTYADYTWGYPYNQGSDFVVLQNGDTVSSPFTINFSITQPTTLGPFNSVEETNYQFIPCTDPYGLNIHCATVRIYYSTPPPAGSSWGLVNWQNQTDWSGAAGALNVHDTYADYSFYTPYVPSTPYQYILTSSTDFSSPFTIDWSTLPTSFPPTINVIPNATLNEGDIYFASSSFTDSNPNATSWTATVDYGDGTGVQNLLLSGQNFTLSHQYKDEGKYTVTVSITDNQGATGTGTATVTVNDATPNVGAITVSNSVIQVNSSITASANFTDPGVLDTHNNAGTYWDWGDGSTTQATVTESNGSGSVSDSHTYTNTGVYTVTLHIADDDSVSNTSTYQYISVYAPTNQGVFSAGQALTSPVGAYAQNPTLTGPVQFGLAYKYNGGSPVSVRQLMLNFKLANLTFNATTITALVISNGTATLTGTGTINGSGTYNFAVVGVNGGDIRIQITDLSRNVIYDTQPGTPLTTTPTTPVTGHVIVN